MDNLRENGRKNQSPAGLSIQGVDGSPASPPSLKRRHKPNTLYANDFVFISSKKSKVDKCKLEPVSKRKALPGNETADSNLEKAEQGTVDDVKNDSQRQWLSASDLTLSGGRKCGAKKRGRKPKHYSDIDISLEVAENTESESLPSSLNLSLRGAPLRLGEKASNCKGRKPHSANTSLSHEDLRTGFADSLSVQSKVPLTVQKKRGRPPKKPVGELSSKIGEKSAGILTSTSQLSVNSPRLLDASSRTDSELYSTEIELPLSDEKKCGRPPKKLSGDSLTKTRVQDAHKLKADVSHDKKLTVANVNLANNHLGIDGDSSSERTETRLSVPIRRGRPKKTVDDTEFSCVHCSETFLTPVKIRSHMAHRHHRMVSCFNLLFSLFLFYLLY